MWSTHNQFLEIRNTDFDRLNQLDLSGRVKIPSV